MKNVESLNNDWICTHDNRDQLTDMYVTEQRACIQQLNESDAYCAC